MFSGLFRPSHDCRRTTGYGLSTASLPFPALALQRTKDGTVAQRTRRVAERRGQDAGFAQLAAAC